MAQRLFCPPKQTLKFRETSFDLLTDFLININERNKDNINCLSKCSGSFKDKRLIEHVLLMTQDLGLDPQAGYQAVELLHRFMVKRLTDLLSEQPASHEDAVFHQLKEDFPIVVFSCVQLASKLSLHSCTVTNSTAVHFLHSVGYRVSKQTLLETELMILKGLDFKLDAPNPLTYVEVLLEVLGHNEPSVPVELLHELCCRVLEFVSLQRTNIYDALLRRTTRCASPSTEQRKQFVTVPEDYMLLGAGVIAVATFTLHVRKWEQVVEELSHITGISRRSISDFTYVTLMHLVQTSSL